MSQKYTSPAFGFGTAPARPALFGCTAAERTALYRLSKPHHDCHSDTIRSGLTHDSGTSGKLRMHVLVPPVRTNEARFGSKSRVEMAIGFPTTSRGMTLGTR